MRIYLDYNRRVVYFDATGGDLGPVTTAGRVAIIFARDYPELLNPAGWDFEFYPESGKHNNDFPLRDEVVDLDGISWYSVASAIAERIKEGRPVQKCCEDCGTCPGCNH